MKLEMCHERRLSNRIVSIHFFGEKKTRIKNSHRSIYFVKHSGELWKAVGGINFKVINNRELKLFIELQAIFATLAR